MSQQRARMHLYTKSQIDASYLQAIYCNASVKTVKLSVEDITIYKSDYKEQEFESYLKEKHDYEPPYKKMKKSEKEPNILKLVLSREGETDKFKSHFKSTLNNDKENILSTVNSETTRPIDACEEESVNQNTHTTVSAESDLNLNNSNNKYGKIRLRDPKTLIEESRYLSYMQTFFEDLQTPPANCKKATTSTVVSTNGTFSNVTRGNLSLNTIEKLYNKYFSKIVQDEIVIIANILNIISMSNKHHKARMDESFKKRTEAEKLKERYDANKQHSRHKTVLEAKLKKFFMDVITTFIDSEFEPTFQMFFLSILTVLRVLDQPKFKKGSIFKNLVLLLWNSLKNSEFEHPKVFSMFRSKAFRPECIDLISLIEDSRDNDPGITDRMALFFVSTVNSQEYFKTVFDAVTSDTNEELALLIDTAAFNCRLNSRFKDPMDYSLLDINKHATTTASSSTAVQNTIKIQDDGIKHWVIAQTTNGNYQPIPISTESKVQKSNNLTLGTSSTSLPINSYYEAFSSSLLTRVSSDTTSTKVIAPKVSVVASPSVASTSSGPTATIVAFKPTAHNIKPITNGIQRSEGNTIFVGNKQYQLIRGPMSQIKALTPTQTSNSIVIRAQSRPPTTEVNIKNPHKSNTMTPTRKRKTAAEYQRDYRARKRAKRDSLLDDSTTAGESITADPSMVINPPITCFSSNCQNPATIMCSSCTSVKYCSHNCQRLDWYETHINNCERLQNIQKQRNVFSLDPRSYNSHLMN